MPRKMETPPLPRAKREAMEKWAERAQIFQELTDRGTRRWKLEAKDLRFLDMIRNARGIEGWFAWSSRSVRRAATEALIDVFLDDLRDDPSRPRWLATFCWNEGLASEREPQIALDQLKKKVWKALDEYGLEGVGVVEVDVLRNLEGEPGRRLWFHIHAYCWSADGSRVRPDKWADEMMAGRRFPNKLGAKSVKFKRVTLTKASVARIAGYFGKFPSKAKNVVPSRKHPGKFVMRYAELRPKSTARLMELLSYMQPADAIFGIGRRGKMLRARWRTKFVEWAKCKRGPRQVLAVDHDMRGTWDRMWPANARRRFEPCRITLNATQRKKLGTLRDSLG